MRHLFISYTCCVCGETVLACVHKEEDDEDWLDVIQIGDDAESNRKDLMSVRYAEDSYVNVSKVGFHICREGMAGLATFSGAATVKGECTEEEAAQAVRHILPITNSCRTVLKSDVRKELEKNKKGNKKLGWATRIKGLLSTTIFILGILTAINLVGQALGAILG